MIRVRRYCAADPPLLREIFNDAILRGASGFYNAAQRHAWATAPDRGAAWEDRLALGITLVAERDAVPVGFMTLGPDGYLDLAFVQADHMGSGVAAALHDRLLTEAATLGLARLETEASFLARRFFLKQGWRETREQTVTLDGIALTNFIMEKRVGSG